MVTQTSGGKERTLSHLKDLASRSGFPRCEIMFGVIGMLREKYNVYILKEK